MKHLNSVAICLFSCISFSSCKSETQKNISEVHDISSSTNEITVITRSGDSAAQFRKATSKGNVIVDYFANWCGPCKYMVPILNQVAAQYPNVRVVKVDVDQFPELSQGIKSIPVIRFYKDGRQVYSKPGAHNLQQLASLIKQHFN